MASHSNNKTGKGSKLESLSLFSLQAQFPSSVFLSLLSLRGILSFFPLVAFWRPDVVLACALVTDQL